MCSFDEAEASRYSCDCACHTLQAQGLPLVTSPLHAPHRRQRSPLRSITDHGSHRSLNVTVTVMITGTGTPFSSVGV